MTAWDCPACGTHNSGYHATCTMCGANRTPNDAATVPIGPSAPPPPPVDPSPAVGLAGSWLDVNAPPAPDPQATVPRWQPATGPPPVPESRPSPPRRAWGLVAAAVTVLLIGAAALFLIHPWTRGRAVLPSPSPTRVPTTGPTATVRPPDLIPSPTPTPTAAGLVRDDTGSDDPRVSDVVAMFTTYFSGINSKNYSRALSVFDPGGVINPNDATQAAAFRKAVSTSTDDDIALRGLAPDSTGRGTLQAQVTFRSQQDPGYGPKGSENETCTRWEITYVLTGGGGSGYRILNSPAAAHGPC